MPRRTRTRLKGTLLDGDGSGVEKRLTDHLCVVGLEKRDNPLPDRFLGTVLELDVELHILLDVEVVFRPPPFASNLPFRLAQKEVEVMGFRPGDYDGEEFPVLGIAGLLKVAVEEQDIQLILYGLNWHLLRVCADFVWGNWHSIMVAKSPNAIK